MDRHTHTHSHLWQSPFDKLWDIFTGVAHLAQPIDYTHILHILSDGIGQYQPSVLQFSTTSISSYSDKAIIKICMS